jgi:hypothetical protein
MGTLTIKDKIFHTSDSPGYFYTSSVSEEFDNLFLDLLSKHKDLPFEICICLRCLWKNSNWKTKATFHVEKYDSKGFNKGDFWLGIDVVCFVEDFEAIRNNKVLQRLAFGKETFACLTDKFNKSTQKVPYLKQHKDAMLLDIKNWFLANYWLKENECEPINFDIKNWTLPKAELVFGKPVSKKVTDEIDEQIYLENDFKSIKYQNLVWDIDNNRQIESWFYLNENKEWLCCWFEIKSAN